MDHIKKRYGLIGKPPHLGCGHHASSSLAISTKFVVGSNPKVIELLNNNNSLSNEKRQYCEKIIDSVGEPIISNKLRNMLRDF